VKRQAQMCKQNLELMGVVAHATYQAAAVCQELFSDSRWNCSSIVQAPNLLADLTGGSREQAFVYALSAAAVAQSVSKACSLGATTKCSCGRLPTDPPPGDFKWGGCGDDLPFGLAFSRTFTDAPFSSKQSKKKSKRAAMNVHNNNAGRQLVSQSLKTSCKCHGVSGSCSIKTCWKALPSIQELGQALQRRYAVAVEVENRKVERRRKLVPVSPDRDQFSDEELIYYTKSSDYCLPDTSLGSLGTHGRQCRKDHDGSGGCRTMCCGRGFTSQVVEQRQRCECKYYWCCYVKCKTCIRKVEINRCR